MKSFRIGVSILLLAVSINTLTGQITDIAAFRKMAAQERRSYLHQLPYFEMDSLALRKTFDILLPAALDLKDARSAFVLEFHRFLERGKLRIPEKELLPLLAGMEKQADDQGWKVERLVSHHYYSFQAYTTHQLPHEKMYLEVIKTFEGMEELGFDQFRDYGAEQILYHLSRFMWDLEDYEKAFQYLQVAERYIQPTAAGEYHLAVILNMLQTYYQQKKDYSSAIAYARRIIDVHKTLRAEDPDNRWNYHFWQGLASLDIAAMYLEQGELGLAEQYAASGYGLSKVAETDRDYASWYAEFDALQVLLSIKLKTGKLEEADALIARAEEIKKVLDAAPDLTPFRYLKFYKHCAQYHELRGEYVVAMDFTRLVQTIQDSLNRRNDARKFEQIKRRHEAEKYLTQIQLVENEKRLNQWLLAASLVILLLLIVVVYLNYRRLLARREEAEAAQNDLAVFAQDLREKSEMVEKLRQELDKLAHRNEHSEYLEQLTSNAILTDEDWQRFRALFEKVHPQFLNEQKIAHPELTTGELRLLALEKLSLTDFEIANLLGISAKTVHQTRWRMRKKLE